MSSSWHGVQRVNGEWSRHGGYSGDPGYKIVASVDDGTDEPYEQGATAAVLQTPEGYWSAEDGGGCSCWSGPSLKSITGPYETLRQALAAISEHLRERFDEPSAWTDVTLAIDAEVE